eukprot:TRINITY_DN10630_c0_g1_i1.p1 TRINITY_DN10630_c0_g1~~TRINITY_DN10630_c0_g1_i1.p1  ORF type:complete len:144 (-),score=45.07 TRINITY_DN10630_c0_g1_i1:57-488(-)
MPLSRLKVFNLAKGYQGRAKNVYSVAIRKVEKGLQYAYRDRKAVKRTMRSLWISNISAGVQAYGMNYSTFMSGMAPAGIHLNRKMLAQLAKTEPYSFKAVTLHVKPFAKVNPPTKHKRITPEYGTAVPTLDFPKRKPSINDLD